MKGVHCRLLNVWWISDSKIPSGVIGNHLLRILIFWNGLPSTLFSLINVRWADSLTSSRQNCTTRMYPLSHHHGLPPSDNCHYLESPFPHLWTWALDKQQSSTSLTGRHNPINLPQCTGCPSDKISCTLSTIPGLRQCNFAFFPDKRTVLSECKQEGELWLCKTWISSNF